MLYILLRNDCELIICLNNLFLFFANFLCALGVVPQIGIFDFAIDFFEASFLAVDVKDTPSAHIDGELSRRTDC